MCTTNLSNRSGIHVELGKSIKCGSCHELNAACNINFYLVVVAPTLNSYLSNFITFFTVESTPLNCNTNGKIYPFTHNSSNYVTLSIGVGQVTYKVAIVSYGASQLFFSFFVLLPFLVSQTWKNLFVWGDNSNAILNMNYFSILYFFVQGIATFDTNRKIDYFVPPFLM